MQNSRSHMKTMSMRNPKYDMALHDVELLNLDTDKSVIRLFLYCTVDMSCHVLHGEVGTRYNGYFS